MLPATSDPTAPGAHVLIEARIPVVVHNIPGGTSYEPKCWVTHVADPRPPAPDALQLVSSTQVTLLPAPQSVPARTLLSETSWQNPGNSLGSKLNINAGTTPSFYSP